MKIYELEINNPILVRDNNIFVLGEILNVCDDVFEVRTNAGIYKRDLKDIKQATQIDLIEHNIEILKGFRTKITNDEKIGIVEAINKQNKISMEIKMLEVKKHELLSRYADDEEVYGGNEK